MVGRKPELGKWSGRRRMADLHRAGVGWSNRRRKEAVGQLIVAALIWIGIHLGIAGTGLRARVAGMLGDGGFRAAFALVSIAAIIFLILSYNRAPILLLWYPANWLRAVLIAVMLPAFILFAAAIVAPSPTSIPGGWKPVAMPQGIQRITRHPMLWSFALWAGVHMIANGDIASLIFFGSFLLTALAGMPSIDAKVARRRPVEWRPYAAASSIIPFAAILQGRNRLVPREIGWTVPVTGALVWIALLLLHPYLFGADPLRS
jgi:uncharacterized membrane protein